MQLGTDCARCVLLFVIFMNLKAGTKVTHENRWTGLYLPTFYALLEGRSVTKKDTVSALW
jgi:hypothetical protein